RPADLEELVRVLVALLPGVALLVSARSAASTVGGVQGAGDRGASARAVRASPSDIASAATAERSALSRRREPAAAALSLAVAPGGADDVVALAPSAGCSPLDVRGSNGTSADQRRDP